MPTPFTFQLIPNHQAVSAWLKAWEDNVVGRPPRPDDHLFYGTGPILAVDRPFRGLTFPSSLVLAEVNRLQGRLPMVGELHGDNGTHFVNMNDISHVVEELWVQGDEVWAKIRLLPLPQGKRAAEMVKVGRPLYGSLRAFGNISDQVVQTIQIASIDLIDHP